MPGRYSYSAESNPNSDKQSVSSGRRTPPYADRFTSSPANAGFVSGSQSLINTPPLAHTPPIAWRQHKVSQEMAASHEAEGKRQDVLDKDLLLAATQKIEAAARGHPGWSSVEATINDRKMKAPPPPQIPERFERTVPTGNANQENSAMFPTSRREAQLQYQARVSAQARQLTHYAPPENLLKLHEQVTAKSAARADAAARSQRSWKMLSGPSPSVASKTGTPWPHESHCNIYQEKPFSGTSMIGNGARLDACNLDLRFLDDESAY
jgi:hypothetical protein